MKKPADNKVYLRQRQKDGTVLKDRYGMEDGSSCKEGWPENATRVEWPSCKMGQELTDPVAKERYKQIVREAHAYEWRQKHIRKLLADKKEVTE